jgi:transposase
MNPVIGLDFSKEESHGQAFLERGNRTEGRFNSNITVKGWQCYFNLSTM